MKKFTDTQKKWALTATMIAVLGCSVSFNSQTYKVTSMEFASEAEVEAPKEKKLEFAKVELPTAEGMLKASLVAVGETTAVHLSPRTDTEGKAEFECPKCLAEAIIIKQPLLKSNLGNISVAIAAELEKVKVTKVATVKIKEEKEENGREEVSEKQKERDERREEARIEREERKAELQREKDQYKDDMALLKDAAEDADCKGEATKADKLECLTRVYTETLEEEIDFKYKNSKGKTKTDSRPLNSKAAYDFYIKNIEPSLKSDLRRSGGNSSLYEVLASIPSDFNNVRERALSGTTVAFYEATVDYRDSILRAKQTQNPADKLKAQQNQAVVQNMYRSLSTSNESALTEAVSRGNIGYDEAVDLYDKGFSRVASSLHDGSSRWLTLNQQGRIVANLDAYQLPTPIGGSLDGLDLNQTLNSTLPPGVLPAPGSRTTNARGAVNARATIVAPTADEVLDGTAQQAIVVLPQGNSNGLQFGQPRTLTQEAKAEADRRNLLQGERF